VNLGRRKKEGNFLYQPIPRMKKKRQRGEDSLFSPPWWRKKKESIGRGNQGSNEVGGAGTLGLRKKKAYKKLPGKKKGEAFHSEEGRTL